jgi:lysozyme family protein
MQELIYVSTLKDIKGLPITRLVTPANNAVRMAGNRSPNKIDFERVLTASLKQLYSDGVKLKQTSAVVTTPVFDPLRNFDLDDESKFREGLKIVLKHEGSRLVKEDGGEESSKYGIIESTAKAYGYKGSIKDLALRDAETIYKKIWEKSGAGSMPHPLSAVHFDTYVNSPSAAKKLLRQSKGNTDVYLNLRLQRYSRVAHLRPERYGKYLNGWVNRVNNLKSIASNYANAYATPRTGKASRS